MVPGAVGSGVPQRWQLRSPGGLATPQAGLVQRLGGALRLGGGGRPAGAGSRSPCRRWRRAAAALPQAGQLAGVAGRGRRRAGRLVPGAGTGGRLTLPSDTLPAEGGSRGAGGGADRDGLRRRPRGTVNGFLHDGQRNCLPAELSATCIAVVQFGQRITCGMVGLVWSLRR